MCDFYFAHDIVFSPSGNPRVGFCVESATEAATEALQPANTSSGNADTGTLNSMLFLIIECCELLCTRRCVCYMYSVSVALLCGSAQPIVSSDVASSSAAEFTPPPSTWTLLVRQVPSADLIKTQGAPGGCCCCRCTKRKQRSCRSQGT